MCCVCVCAYIYMDSIICVGRCVYEKCGACRCVSVCVMLGYGNKGWMGSVGDVFIYMHMYMVVWIIYVCVRVVFLKWIMVGIYVYGKCGCMGCAGAHVVLVVCVSAHVCMGVWMVQVVWIM